MPVTKQNLLARIMAFVKQMEKSLFVNVLMDGKATRVKNKSTHVKIPLAKTEQNAKFPIHLKLSASAHLASLVTLVRRKARFINLFVMIKFILFR